MCGSCGRALLRLVLVAVTCTIALLLPGSLASSSSASTACKAYAGDELLDRLDQHMKLCMSDSHHDLAIDRVKDRLIANEFDQERRPLSLVVFSNDTEILDRFAASWTTAIFGVKPSMNTIRVIDFKALLATKSNYEIKETLRHELASTLQACPRRNTVVLRHTELVRGARLPILDVFLDPMNGERALFHDAVTDKILDCQNSIFLFLFHVPGRHMALPTTWREYLLSQWRSSLDASELIDEAFTPQAMVGRLEDGIELFAHSAESVVPREVASSKRWKDVCVLDQLLERLKTTPASKLAETDSRSIDEGYTVEQLRSIFIALPLFLWLLLDARWSAVARKQLRKQPREKDEATQGASTKKKPTKVKRRRVRK